MPNEQRTRRTIPVFGDTECGDDHGTWLVLGITPDPDTVTSSRCTVVKPGNMNLTT